MRNRLTRVCFCCVLALLLSPALAFANDVTADCTGQTPGAFTSISEALVSMPAAGPNSIFVIGTCTENINIFQYSSLTIFANPGTATIAAANPNRRLLLINDAHTIFIDGINFSGGRGILILNSNDVTIGDASIQNSGLQGINSTNSVVSIFNAAVQNSARPNITCAGGTLSVDGGVTISNGARSGITAVNCHLLLNGGDGTPGTENVISQNATLGVSLGNSTELDANGDNRIINNGSTGLQAIHTCTALWDGGTITDNQGVGVHIGETSHGEFSNVTIHGNGAIAGAGNGGIQTGNGAAGGMEIVENSDAFLDGGVDASSNLATGIYVDESSVLSSLGGNTVNNNKGDGFLIETLAVAHFFAADTATGNTLNSLECDDTSVVVGNVSGFAKLKCAKVKTK